MVGFDAGTEALAVLAEAADLARRLDAQVTVVHAVDLRDYPVDPDASDWEEKLGPALASEQQAAAALLTETNLTWSYRLFRGDPAAALIEAAEEEDALMIVV
ncbi:MAG TPA: universal stress protein, partial [Acidimicrobiales bacterium]|nr:universal stress protein [Acidimicrobiales bacterium]